MATTRQQGRVDILDTVAITLIGLYSVIAPFTKVEESFNMQAIHDVLYYGSDLEMYDHRQFPGVVPRSFIGAGLIGMFLKPLKVIFPSDTKLDFQLFARGILGVVNAYSMVSLRRAIADNWKSNEPGVPRIISIWYLLFQFSQFHVVFYASRALPNMLAFPLVTKAIQNVLFGEFTSAIGLISFAAIVFRAELILFAGSLALVVLISRKASVFQIVRAGFQGLAVGAVLSMVVDGYFWQNTVFKLPDRPVFVPEIYGFVYNVVMGKSSLWGVEPWHAYFTKHIPNMATNPVTIGLIPAGLAFNSPTGLRILAAAATLFVAIYSAQPHKEWRFVVYIMPIVAVTAANGATYCWTRLRRGSPPVFKMLNLVLALSTVGAYLVCFAKLQTSSLNYPGGEALHKFNTIFDPSFESHLPVTVHLDVPVCMSGATRFGEIHNSTMVIYDKTEDAKQLQNIWRSFNYVITVTDDTSSLPSEPGHVWKAISSVKGFRGLNKQFLSETLEAFLQDPQSFTLDFIESLRYSKSLKSDLKTLYYKSIHLDDVVFIYRKVPHNVSDI
jgi:alpha-1,6-mannosyltransferase